MTGRIVGLHLENFQSIRGPVDLAIAPITLLYGPNSAGKSTIYEAISLARQLCQGSDFDDEESLRKSIRNYDSKNTMVIGITAEFDNAYFFREEDTVLYEEIQESCPDLAELILEHENSTPVSLRIIFKITDFYHQIEIFEGDNALIIFQEKEGLVIVNTAHPYIAV